MLASGAACGFGKVFREFERASEGGTKSRCLGVGGGGIRAFGRERLFLGTDEPIILVPTRGSLSLMIFDGRAAEAAVTVVLTLV